jgi:hypothetical protein
LSTAGAWPLAWSSWITAARSNACPPTWANACSTARPWAGWTLLCRLGRLWGCRCRRWRFGCCLRTESCWTLRYAQAEAAQAFVFGAASFFFFALLTGCLAGGNTLFLTAALRIHARLLFRATAVVFFRTTLRISFLLSLFFLAAAFLFLRAALLVLALAFFFLARLALRLKFFDEGHHFADVLVLDVGTRARLNGDTVLLRDGKDLLALHLNGLGQLVYPHSNPRLTVKTRKNLTF